MTIIITIRSSKIRCALVKLAPCILFTQPAHSTSTSVVQSVIRRAPEGADTNHKGTLMDKRKIWI